MFSVTPASPSAAVLAMDDGKVNAMGPRFVEAFPAAFREAAAGGRAVVLAGNGRAFSAGLDLKTLPTLDEAQAVAFAKGFMAMFREVAAHPGPVVAAVDGPALAGGAVLALCADFRLVGDGAKLGLTEVPVGIPFPQGVAELGRANLPPHEHAPALLDGAVRQGAECVARGWAHAHLPRERLVEDAVALGARLAGHNPLAYASAKRELCAQVVEAFDRFDAAAWIGHLQQPETMAALMRTLERLQRK